MSYESIDQKLGQKMAPYIANVLLDDNDDVFITPYGNRQIRFRSYFDTNNTIYLCLTEKEVNQMVGNIPSCNMFLYGAFNQIYIKQIQIFGLLSALNDDGVMYQTLIDRLINGKYGNDELKLKPNQRDHPSSY